MEINNAIDIVRKERPDSLIVSCIDYQDSFIFTVCPKDDPKSSSSATYILNKKTKVFSHCEHIVGLLFDHQNDPEFMKAFENAILIDKI